MEDFIEKKKAYFEKLRNNREVLELLTAKDSNAVEAMSMMIDPQNETELELADGIFTFFSDTIKIFTESYKRDYKERDLSEVQVVDYFVRAIIALKNSDKEALEAIKVEISQTASPAMVAEMFYDLLSIMMFDAEAIGGYVCEKSGFATDDYLSVLQFQLYFKKANEFINSCMPNMQAQTVEDMKNPETAKYFKDFIDRFHSLYQRDYENQNNLGK